MNLLPCTLSHMSSIPMGAINFYMQERVLHLLIPLLFKCTCLLFPWVQCQSFKPILSQCSQTSFATVDDFIALYTRSYVFYSHGCNKFLLARTFFTLSDTTAPIITVLAKVLPRANRAMVTNNQSVLTEVCANQNCVNRGFPVYQYILHIKHCFHRIS